MILVTGAAGKTGRSVVRQLVARKESVRGLAFRHDQVRALESLGATDVVTGNMCDPSVLATAMHGIQTVYHICPNMHPAEHAIGKLAIAAASSAGVNRFVFHSVLLPGVEAMPHHWQKHLVEDDLRVSGLAHTILRPCAYMQNMLPQWDRIATSGEIVLPYAVTSRLSMVDLENVAEAAAIVLSSAGHEGATYELCGPDSLSQEDVAEILAGQLNEPVRASVVALADWERDARSAGLSDYAVDSLLKMFEYYHRHGLSGRSQDLERLLNRPSTPLTEFVRRTVAGEGESS